MSDHTGTYRVEVESPHGKQAVEEFRHFLGKVSDDAKQRWGIDISIERIEDAETPDNGGFNE